MLAQEDLETLLHDLESDRVERTMPIRLLHNVNTGSDFSKKVFHGSGGSALKP